MSEREHVTEGLGCWCGPRVEAYGDAPDMETCPECGVTSSGMWAHRDGCSRQTIRDSENSDD